MKDHAEDQAYPFSSRWEKTCALFDPTISIPRHAIESPDGAKRVWFSRDWRNYDNGAAVWTKEYDKLGYDLRSFNTAERDILQTLKLLPNCYQLVENYDKTSKLAPLDPKAQRSGSYIAMTDMGPTAYDWLEWPVRVGVERRRLDNLFALPGNFIRLALAGLRSLSDIHDKNFVHLDYRLPNVCLAPRGRSIPCKDREGDYLKIQLDWHTLKAIDFGFSIARGKTPYTLLPPLEAATPAARALIDEVEEIGRDKFNSLTPTERNALKASDFSDVQHNHTFWTSHCPGALDHLRAIDWREDCYQFGIQLQKIREDASLLEFLDQNRYLRNVGEVISAIEKLPEKLVALGQGVTAYPALNSTEARQLEQERRDTYRRLIRGLEIAVRDMPADWYSDEVLIFRSDIVEPHADSAPQRTAVRQPARSFPWKKAAAAAAAVAGTASGNLVAALMAVLMVVLLGALASLLEWWTKTSRTIDPLVEVAQPPQPVSPVSASDPASACLKNGAWEAACGFAAYAGGPVFRVLGGNLSFSMGSPATEKDRDNDEGPQHLVSFQRRFALAETEVSVANYLACVQDGGCREPLWREAGSEYHYQTGSNTWYRDKNAHEADSPITGVSWNDAKAYVAWLSGKTRQTYTLPTEAQWEYAARGGQSGRWYFGDNESQLKDHAWYSDNAGSKLHPVGSTRLNTHPWGLKDMAGNAWEWVEDCSHINYVNAPANGYKAWEGANGGDCDLRVFRGGSWFDYERNTRAANRDGYSTDVRHSDVSFRPSRMLP